MAERITAGKPASLGASASALLNTILQGDDGGAHAPSTAHLNPASRSEWLNFPAMGVPEVDELGFKRIAGRLGESSPLGLANDVSIACSQVGAILRRIDSADDFTDIELSKQAREDLSILVGAALALLPEQHVDQITEGIAAANREANGIIRQKMLEGGALRLMLKSTTMAGWKAATPEEIDRAAATAHACAHVLADGRELLEGFAAVVESRGMAVEWLDCGENMPRWPKVHASQAALEKSRRKYGKDRHVAHEAILRLDLEHQKRPG